MPQTDTRSLRERRMTAFMKAQDDLIAALDKQPADALNLSMKAEQALLVLYAFSLEGEKRMGSVLIDMLKEIA